jgi:hypothetical protein
MTKNKGFREKENIVPIMKKKINEREREQQQSDYGIWRECLRLETD